MAFGRPSNWRRSVVLPARKQAKISDRFRVHDLRHTAVAFIVQAGFPPKMLQEILGHASITTTLDLYGHLYPGDMGVGRERELTCEANPVAFLFPGQFLDGSDVQRSRSGSAAISMIALECPTYPTSICKDQDMTARHQNQVNQRRSQLLTVLEPQLLPGERVELLSFAMIGKTPVKKNAALLAVSAAAAAATGGTVITIVARRSYYVLLTNQRLLVVANDRRSGGFGTIKLATHREAVTPTMLANRFFVKARLDIQGSEAPLHLSYAASRPSKKAEGRALIAALGNSSAAEAAAY